MPTTIEVLDPAATSAALSGNRFGESETLGKIAESLMTVLDTEGSVYVEGLNESNINALRTKMYRRDVKTMVRKVRRDGKVGHVLTARTVA